MKKIPTLFERNPDDRAHVLPVVNDEAAWVLSGEGLATQKFDGTCVRLDDGGAWWTRREVKLNKTAPDGFVPVEVDRVTQKVMGWMPAASSSFAKYLHEAIEERPMTFWDQDPWPAGTYELIGPRINGNPENVKRHTLVAHGSVTIPDLDLRPGGDPFTFLAARLRSLDDQAFTIRDARFEGVVWHHPDGRMAKLKVRDFA